jgi:hypothetical protein
MNDYVSLPIDFVTYVIKQWADGGITADEALSVLLTGQEEEKIDAN